MDGTEALYKANFKNTVAAPNTILTLHRITMIFIHFLVGCGKTLKKYSLPCDEVEEIPYL